MRPWDNFFWWIELAGPLPRTVVLPDDWPPPPTTRPLSIEGKTTPGNSVIGGQVRADEVRVGLGPELVDLSRPITVTINGRSVPREATAPDASVMLEDLRTAATASTPSGRS